MAKLGINTGILPNDGSGDSLLEGAIKINSNFNEIYNAIGNGTTITNSIGYASTAGIATYATSSGISTYSTSSGIATYATSSGIATYATSAGVATYATTAGIATISQGLTGTPDITVGSISASRLNSSGIVTASSFRPSSGFIQAADGTNSIYIYDATGNAAFQGTIGASKVNNASGYLAIDFSPSTNPIVLIPNGLNVTGVVTATDGFASGITTAPVKISVSAGRIVFTVAGIGSTSFQLI